MADTQVCFLIPDDVVAQVEAIRAEIQATQRAPQRVFRAAVFRQLVLEALEERARRAASHAA